MNRWVVLLLLCVTCKVSATSHKEGVVASFEGAQIEAEFYPSDKDTTVQSAPELVTLSNGMKVYLKPTPYDPGEVFFMAIAKGGYALLPPQERVSFEVAPQVGWVAGWGEFNKKLLSTKFATDSIEFTGEVLPFSRIIEASFGTESTEDFLNLFFQLFEQPKFTKEAAENVLNQLNESYERAFFDANQLFEECTEKVNFFYLPEKRSLNAKSLKDFKFEKARELFLNVFLNLKDYTLAFVGDFDQEKLVKDLENHIQTFKPRTIKTPSYLKDIPYPERLLPPGVKKEYCYDKRVKEGYVRLTLPIKITINEENLLWVEFTTQLIETHLRELFLKRYGTTLGVDVAYEFPLSPSLDHVWLLIQFRNIDKKGGEVADLIIKDLNLLKNLGASEEELEGAIQQQRLNDGIWKNENSYWLASMINYVQWGLDLNSIGNTLPYSDKNLKSRADQFLKKYLQTDVYTQTILQDR